MKHVTLIAPIDMNNEAHFLSMRNPLGWPLEKNVLASQPRPRLFENPPLKAYSYMQCPFLDVYKLIPT